MRQLHEKYKDGRDVVFIAIEQKEPHAGRLAFEEIEQPTTFDERRALAVKSRDEFQIPFLVLVDGMDDASRALFGDLPSPAFVMDRSGRIRDKLPWADPDLLEPLLGKMVEEGSTADATAPSTLAEAFVQLRAALAKGTDPAAAAARVEKALEHPEAADAAHLAEARIALAVFRASAGADTAASACKAAAEAAARAYVTDAARLVAAYVELAQSGPPAGAREFYRAALAALESRAPRLQRAWLESRIADSAPK